MEKNQQSKLRELLSMYVDGELDRAGLTELETMLANDADAQKAYISFLTTHSDLSLLSPFVQSSEDNETYDKVSRLERNSLPSKTPVELSSNGSELRSKSGFPLIAAACAAMACVALGLLFYPQLVPTSTDVVVDQEVHERSEVQNIDTAMDQKVVARIIRKIDCDWEGNRWEVVSSSNIVAGQTLMMRRGLMELEFTSGARVTLEGPVVFTAESPMNGFLSQGKLTSVVPESAHGFTVDSPESQTVDLGTEFGMFVDENGVTETHVFDGEVIVRPAFAKKQQEDIHLSNDMAIRTESAKQTVSPLLAVPARFAYCNFEDAKKVPAPVVDRKLVLWLSAEHLVQVDEDKKVRSWGDIETVSNTKREVAWQVEDSKRPLLVDNAIGDKPAVRFGKKTLMVTEPIELADEQTIVAVFKIDRSAMEKLGFPKQTGRQLINLNGPPHLSLRVNNKFQLTSQNYSGFVKTKSGKRDYLTVGRLKYENELEEVAVVAVSVYSSSKNVSQLYINGALVDAAKAPPMKATKSTRYLGAHMFLPRTNFLGDIGEMMIYDTSLTEKEVVDLSRSLTEKYAIKTSVESVDKMEGSEETK